MTSDFTEIIPTYTQCVGTFVLDLIHYAHGLEPRLIINNQLLGLPYDVDRNRELISIVIYFRMGTEAKKHKFH